jgi:superfamily II DNA/RNA helicase
MSFADLGLSSEVLQAVADAGYTVPTPIQQQAIPHVLTGRDVLGCAQTGTGKTAGFTLPMIDILAAGRARARMPRSLILEPTRELAAQVSNAFETYGKYHKLDMALLIGGESFVDQERKLDRGVDVLIATPGRLIDLFERGKILLSDVKILVIDEADRMLDMGFIPDIERIVGLLPKIRQTLFFSATMPPEIRRLADAFLMNPKEVSVAPPASPAATVAQHLITVQPQDKREALRRLIRSEDVKNAIIFCNRKRDVDILYRSLAKHGLNVAALHGDMPQPKRTETLERFKEGEVRLLVASDVAARGLDIQGMSHVFNFDVPIHAEDYVHRIGRTGRAGRDGRAFTIATPDDGRFLAAITKLIGKDIPAVTIEGLGQAESAAEESERPRRGRGGRERSHGNRRDGRERRRPSEERREPAARPLREAPRPITMEPEGKVLPLPMRRDERPHDDDRRVVGFGDHLPAFLARPGRVARG